MTRLAERLLSAAGTVWLAGTLAFFALRLLPGDAIQSQLMQSGASPVVIADRRARLGLDEPLLIQYGRLWLDAARGSLGYSLLDGQPVTDMIRQRLGPTVALASGAVVVAVALGLTLGTVAALQWPMSPAARLLVNLALSTPLYWTGTLAIWLFAVLLGWLPSSGGEGVAQLLLPVSVLGFHSAGGIARMVETSLRETLAADFIRTARAKGLPERLVLRRHVLRAGLLPVITVVALQAGFLLGGTVITESLFVRPGLGRLLLDSTLQQDYPAVQGITLFLAMVYAGFNLLADALYAWLDPRVALAA
ncbi:MAG: ABC transporter permease [Chloroflexi bacterium]|nr:ABC transporter permease [Chloroflexota bacterium]